MEQNALCMWVCVYVCMCEYVYASQADCYKDS